ncbi:MAG: SDR family NAD(P)-dependent oxidoreductase [Hyphomicrobiaceae bacterium]|nr:SDR family NAD(P)-dependent oxidoreductase [Hyphomicrobiaceae bacterium]
MNQPRRIAITGASSGLGAALARALSAPGVTLHLCARGAEGLAQIERECGQRGAQAICRSIDLRDPQAGPAWIAEIEIEGPIDLLILNAGIFAGRVQSGMAEPLDIIPALVGTNLTAPLLCATAAVSAMRSRGHGQIVLISSLAAVSASPDAPTYGATKAALSAYGKALGDDLAGTGVTVHVVEPGHILSHHTDQQNGVVPLAISADVAAMKIVRGLESGAALISFPLLSRAYVRLISLLPRSVRLLIDRNQRFTVRNDPTSAK